MEPNIQEELTLVEFLRAAERRVKSGAPGAEVFEPILGCTPVVLPAQYLGSSGRDVPVPNGIWPPFMQTLFYCSANNGTAVAAMTLEALQETVAPTKKFFFQMVRDRFPTQQFDEMRRAVQDATKVIVCGFYFADKNGPGPMFMEVAGEAYMFANNRNEWLYPPITFAIPGEQNVEFAETITMGGVNVMVSCMELLSCRNISTRSEAEPLTKKQRKHGRTGFEWKTIIVAPGTKISSVSGDEHGIPLADLPRLHECRGHFKEYKDRPLFGKYTGRFFWHQHMRGSEKRGSIGHEKYEIKGGPNK